MLLVNDARSNEEYHTETHSLQVLEPNGNS